MADEYSSPDITVDVGAVDWGNTDSVWNPNDRMAVIDTLAYSNYSPAPTVISDVGSMGAFESVGNVAQALGEVTGDQELSAIGESSSQAADIVTLANDAGQWSSPDIPQMQSEAQTGAQPTGIIGSQETPAIPAEPVADEITQEAARPETAAPGISSDQGEQAQGKITGDVTFEKDGTKDIADRYASAKKRYIDAGGVDPDAQAQRNANQAARNSAMISSVRAPGMAQPKQSVADTLAALNKDSQAALDKYGLQYVNGKLIGGLNNPLIPAQVGLMQAQAASAYGNAANSYAQAGMTTSLTRNINAPMPIARNRRPGLINSTGVSQ